MKILLIEPDAYLASLIRDELIKDGHEVYTANDGCTAIKGAKTTAPEMMIMEAGDT